MLMVTVFGGESVCRIIDVGNLHLLFILYVKLRSVFIIFNKVTAGNATKVATKKGAGTR